MSILDRDWMRSGNPHSSRGNMSVVTVLVVLNAIIFLIGFFLRRDGQSDALEIWGCYSFTSVFDQGQVWRLITYQFLHANLGHVVLNMVALWVFGRATEQIFGSAKFLTFYLICGIAAALFSSALGYFGFWNVQIGSIPDTWKYIPMVGASGSIYGLIAASAVLLPHARIQLLFPPVDMSVRTFSLAILGIAVAVIAMNWDNAGGEAGHMGGMLMGFFLMGSRELLLRLHEGSSSFDARKSIKRKNRGKDKTPTREEVDAILDKIGKHGLASLSEHEQEVLRSAAKSPRF